MADIASVSPAFGFCCCCCGCCCCNVVAEEVGRSGLAMGAVGSLLAIEVGTANGTSIINPINNSNLQHCLKFAN